MASADCVAPPKGFTREPNQGVKQRWQGFTAKQGCTGEQGEACSQRGIGTLKGYAIEDHEDGRQPREHSEEAPGCALTERLLACVVRALL